MKALDTQHLNEWLQQHWEKALFLVVLAGVLIGGGVASLLSADEALTVESRSCPARKSFLDKKTAFEFAGESFAVSAEALSPFGAEKPVVRPPAPNPGVPPATPEPVRPVPKPLPANKPPVISRLDVSLDKADLKKKAVWISSEASDPDGTVDRWVFSFGDGQQETLTAAPPIQGVMHAYEKAGRYTVELVCTDNKGGVSRRVAEPIVVGNGKPGGPGTGGKLSITYTSSLPIQGQLKVFLKFDRGAAGGLEVKPLLPGESYLGVTLLKASPTEVLLRTDDGKEIPCRKNETVGAP